jgi:hypothetical protein
VSLIMQPLLKILNSMATVVILLSSVSVCTMVVLVKFFFF